MPAKKPKSDEKPQRERFIEAAREAGANETEEGFEEAFKGLHVRESQAPDQKKAAHRAARPKADR